MFSNSAFTEGSLVQERSEADIENQDYGNVDQNRSDAQEPVPPSQPESEITETFEQNVVSDLVASIDAQCREQKQNSQSTTESTSQLEAHNVNVVCGLLVNIDNQCTEEKENSQLTAEPTSYSGVQDLASCSEDVQGISQQQPPKFSPICFSDGAPECSLTEQKECVTSETTTSSCSTSSPLHLFCTSAVDYDLSQNAEEDSAPLSTGGNSGNEFVFDISSSDTDLETPCPEETSPNVFFPKGKAHEQKFQELESKKDSTEIQSPTANERQQWKVMNHKYIQKDGYRLGIRPGIFYSTNDGYFVEVPNGVNYEIILTNENVVPCNVDVYIDSSSLPAISFRLRPGKPRKFDGPTCRENKFVFLRSKDAPSVSGIKPGHTNNGLIHAVFIPQKVEHVRGRAVSEPLAFSRSLSNALEVLGIEPKTTKPRAHTTSCSGVERGIDIAAFCQGATALRGEQAPKLLKRADSMEVDETRRVDIRLRLIARIDDPCLPSDEDICSLFPPSIEELQER